ncbi:hypothetical protein [Rhodobacter lacus]|uniref:Transporter n=1 Tax=Rhodobacter lacus TaxID=1641972 RepID=A0ABW5AAM3_9RHOB
MQSWVILAAVTAATLVADYLIKLASTQSHGLTSPIFLLGAVIYGLGGIGWFFLMRSHSLASVGVIYSAATILLLAGLGIVVFHEPFGWRETLGIGLAVAAVVVMNSG